MHRRARGNVMSVDGLFAQVDENQPVFWRTGTVPRNLNHVLTRLRVSGVIVTLVFDVFARRIFFFRLWSSKSDDWTYQGCDNLRTFFLWDSVVHGKLLRLVTVVNLSRNLRRSNITMTYAEDRPA